MKNVTGQTRQPIMTLAANSVTKVRVYIYLEGQDVDNYDLITNDLNISVNFGFTKEKTYSGELVDDSFFLRNDESYEVEIKEYIAGQNLILVYTNASTPGFTYNGNMMYDISDRGYTYNGEHYTHTYGYVITGIANASNVVMSDSPAIKIDRSLARNIYDINADGIVDQNDTQIVSDCYISESYTMESSFMPTLLYTDINLDKKIDVINDASLIITHYDDISFKIDGVTYYAKSNMAWRNWIGSDYNTDGYTLAISAEMGTPRYIGKPDTSGNTNYACGVGFLSNRPSAYSCIFGSGSRIKAIIEIPVEEYDNAYGYIIANHNYVTFIAGGSGPL